MLTMLVQGPSVCVVHVVDMQLCGWLGDIPEKVSALEVTRTLEGTRAPAYKSQI